MSENLDQLKKRISIDIATTFNLGKHEHQTASFQVSYFQRRYPDLTKTISKESLSKLVESELLRMRKVFD